MRRVICLFLLLFIFGCREEKMSYSWTSSTIFDSTYQSYDGQAFYALDSNNLFIVFNDWNTYALCFSKSTDGGTSWSTPVTIDSNWGAFYSDRSMWVSSDGQTIYVVYASEYWDYHVYFASSTNGGTSWSTGQLDSSASEDAFPSISVYGSYIFVAFTPYYGTSPQYVRLAISSNGGSSWTFKNVRQTIYNQYNDVQIKALDENTIYVVAGTYPGSWELSFSKTSDQGDTWTHTHIDDLGGLYGVGWTQTMYVKDSDTIYIAYGKPYSAPIYLYLAKSTDAGDTFALSTIDTTPTTDVYFWSSIGSPDNGNTIIVSYSPYYGSVKNLYVSYTTNGGSSWTREIADSYSGCGIQLSLVCINNTIFIVHSTWGTASCAYCTRLTKAQSLITGLYFRSTGINAGYYTKDSTSPSLLTSKDSNGMINAGGSPSPYLDHSSATDYYRKEF